MARFWCGVALLTLSAFASGCGFDGAGAVSPDGSQPDAPAVDAALLPDAAPPPDGPPPPPSGIVVAPAVTTPPVLDGSLADWAGMEFTRFDIARSQWGTFEAGYRASVEASFAAVHDAANIYLAFQVIDDGVLAVDTDSVLTDDDGLLLFFETTAVGAGHFELYDAWYALRGGDGAAVLGGGTDLHAEFGYLRQPGGRSYIFEVKIPKPAIDQVTYGFDLQLRDEDDGAVADDANATAEEEDGPDGLGLWFQADRPRCHDGIVPVTCCAPAVEAPLCDTSFYATLMLAP